MPRIALTNAPPQILPAELDDSVPLPERAVVRSKDAPNAIERPASGDPNFLGFAAGEYSPPKDERVDPELLAAIQPSPRDGRPSPTIYAFAMFERRITPERIAELESMGVRVLGFHPYYALKLAIPVDSFESVAAYPAIHWLGSAKSWQKVHPLLAKGIATAMPDTTLDLVVDVFESDLNPSSTEESFGSASRNDRGVITPEPLDSKSAPLWCWAGPRRLSGRSGRSGPPRHCRS